MTNNIWTNEFIDYICQLFVDAKNEKGKRGQNKARMAYQQAAESLQMMGIVDTSTLFNWLEETDAQQDPFTQKLHSNGLLPSVDEADKLELTDQTTKGENYVS